MFQEKLKVVSLKTIPQEDESLKTLCRESFDALNDKMKALQIQCETMQNTLSSLEQKLYIISEESQEPVSIEVEEEPRTGLFEEVIEQSPPKRRGRPRKK